MTSSFDASVVHLFGHTVHEKLTSENFLVWKVGRYSRNPWWSPIRVPRWLHQSSGKKTTVEMDNPARPHLYWMDQEG
jgi:hypothetical protein